MPEWALHYDEVRWSAGPFNIPGIPFGECAHRCDHKRNVVIARGPDCIRTMLVRCTDTGCSADPSIQCRAWYTERNTPWTKWLGVWVGATA